LPRFTSANSFLMASEVMKISRQWSVASSQ
jgi:hypothetical protein